MTTPSSGVPEPGLDPPMPAPAATRPMYWSVRRELWENRSIPLAPLIVAAVVLSGFLMSTVTLPRRVAAAALDPAKQRAALATPFHVVAGLVVLTAFIVGVFYCLEALHGERRDRSILFWKSLPVSDRTTVLAKATIPLLILPALVFAIVVTAQLIMMLLSSAVLLGNRMTLATLSTHVKLFPLWVAILYALIAMALWHAPLYGWLLLVSAWARRATFLWAVLPPLALAAFERMAFGTSYFGSLLAYRLIGWFPTAFVSEKQGGGGPVDPLAALTPGTFLATPGLWVGLAFAAAFLAAAVRLRRDREPI